MQCAGHSYIQIGDVSNYNWNEANEACIQRGYKLPDTTPITSDPGLSCVQDFLNSFAVFLSDRKRFAVWTNGCIVRAAGVASTNWCTLFSYGSYTTHDLTARDVNAQVVLCETG